MLRRWRKSIALMISLGCFSIEGLGQTTFNNLTESYLGSSVYQSSLAVGINDMNGDELDDIIIMNTGKELKILLNNGVGQPMEIIEYGPKVSSTAEWSFALGDLNNDDIPEIFTSGVYNSVKVFEFDPMRKSIVRSQRISSGAYGQGSNVMDIDLDGFNDYFLCHDEGESRVFLNEGDGTLKREDGYIDFSTNPESDMSGNYGSEWVDLDDDGIPELYMVKCSVRASEFTDPRRINQLFKVNDQGVYVDIASEVGLAFGDQSWSGNFLDMDNDGDLDGVVINHHSPHIFFRNDGGVFTEVDLGYSLTSFDFQVMSADLDNNGYTDIVITGGEDYILYNLGDYNFILEEEPFGFYHVHTASLGDIDNDGFIDAYVGYGKPILEPGNRRDALWINKGNDNNYVKFSLKGKTVNRSAIGAKVKLFSSLGVQQRFIQGGQSYGVVLSDILHFGMGEQEVIDSIEIIWPGGLKEKFQNLGVNQHYLVEEGGCITAFANVQADKDEICLDENTIVSLPDSLFSVKWSDGTNDMVKTIDKPGLYSGRAINSSGCQVPIVPFIITDKGIAEFQLQYEDTIIICEGDLIGPKQEYVSYVWNDGSIEQSIAPLEEGTYSITVQDICGEGYTDEVFVQFEHDELVNKADTVKKDSIARLTVGGHTTYWYASEDDEAPLYFGDTLISDPLTVDTSFYYEVVSFPSSESSVVGINRNDEDNPYANNTLNAVMRFNAIEGFTLINIEVNTDTPGDRRIVIFNSSGGEIYEKTFSLSDGKNILNLDAEISKGNGYRITTDGAVNMDEFGFEGPRLTRSSIDVFYPYTDDELIAIEGSENGPNYYYFYNWEVEQLGAPCTSVRFKYDVVVDFSESTSVSILSDHINIYPNPADDFIEIINSSGVDGKLLLSDITGKLILQEKINDHTTRINISSIQVGLYAVSFVSRYGIYSQLVVIAK
ncbi:MAG: T9SS type A sorting domain-containing protein [Saprospiraceae bacterium]|nr:T9SS type A sorting domain-containing protein [Saprospiraceae bacterium]